MNLAIQNRCQDYRQLGICLSLLIIFAFAPAAQLQTTVSSDNFLSPPSSNLVPVHWPDLTQLEPEVREQLVSSQNALAAAVKNPTTSAAMLSEAYGGLGEIYQAYSLVSPARECYLNANRLTPKD